MDESCRYLSGRRVIELVLYFPPEESENVAFEGRFAHFGDVSSPELRWLE